MPFYVILCHWVPPLHPITLLIYYFADESYVNSPDVVMAAFKYSVSLQFTYDFLIDFYI